MASVFFSYRHSDADIVRGIAAEVQAAGHNVWFDEWEILPGDSIVDRVSSGLKTATHLVMCYSTAGVEASWMSREWMSGLHRQLLGEGIRLIPLRLPGASIPVLIADLAYADFQTDAARGMAQLLRSLA
jgi:hypothetical protein